jgi:hypothetical protein
MKIEHSHEVVGMLDYAIEDEDSARVVFETRSRALGRVP